MAAAPYLTTPLVAYTNADWYEQPLTFWVAIAGQVYTSATVITSANATPVSFAGSTLDMSLAPVGWSGALAHLTTAASTLTVSANSVNITVPRATMAQLPPGLYDFELRQTVTATSIETIILRGQVQIIAGLYA